MTFSPCLKMCIRTMVSKLKMYNEFVEFFRPIYLFIKKYTYVGTDLLGQERQRLMDRLTLLSSYISCLWSVAFTVMVY